MKFYSEKERMQHPQAKLIPKLIMFGELNGELTDAEINLMQISQDDLIPHLKTLRNETRLDKLKAILCCAYRQPFVNDDDLYRMAKEINLLAEDMFKITALTGRLTCLNPLLEY